MEHEHRSDRFTAIEEQYAGYEVYDRNGEKIGKVDDLFVNESERPEYIGVKTGVFGLRSTLVPWEMVRVDEGQRRIEVSESKGKVKDAPNFNDDKDITPEFEREVYSHFGLRREEVAGEERGRYGRTTALLVGMAPMARRDCATMLFSTRSAITDLLG
jgi:hypothetical protein